MCFFFLSLKNYSKKDKKKQLFFFCSVFSKTPLPHGSVFVRGFCSVGIFGGFVFCFDLTSGGGREGESGGDERDGRGGGFTISTKNRKEAKKKSSAFFFTAFGGGFFFAIIFRKK